MPVNQSCLVLNIFHMKAAFPHLVNPLTSSVESINYSAAEFLQLQILEVGWWFLHILVVLAAGQATHSLLGNRLPATASTLCHLRGLSPLGLPCLWVSNSDFNFFEHFPDPPTHNWFFPRWLSWEKEFHFPCTDTASQVRKTAWDSASSANQSLQKGMSRKCHPQAAHCLCLTAASRLSSHAQWKMGHAGNLLPDVDDVPSGQRSDLSISECRIFFLNSYEKFSQNPKYSWGNTLALGEGPLSFTYGLGPHEVSRGCRPCC